jgi:hypothetical protein
LTVRIKNWDRFQHFKDRRPPWIKLYRDILDDKEWHKLDPIAAKDLVSFWLIASEYEGELPDLETLAFRMRKSEAELSGSLSKLSHWLEQDDISVISGRYRVAPVADVSGHQERETEGEGETEKKARVPRTATPSIEGVSPELLADYLKVRKAKRAGELTKTAIAGLQREATKAGVTMAQAITACVEFSWQGFNAGWYAERIKGGAAVPGGAATDPDSKSAIEAEAAAKGMAPWDQLEQFAVYKARVRGHQQPAMSLDRLAAMAAQRQGVH